MKPSVVRMHGSLCMTVDAMHVPLVHV